MDEKTAKAILANLLDRVAQGSTASMTPEMIDAVRLASRKAFGEGFATHTDEAREGDADNEATQETPKPAIVQESIVIHSRSLELVSPEEPEVTLCLDFGTAMSKAFAIRSQGNVLTPIDLALG
jgi:hypothetical protein